MATSTAALKAKVAEIVQETLRKYSARLVEATAMMVPVMYTTPANRTVEMAIHTTPILLYGRGRNFVRRNAKKVYQKFGR